MKRLMMAMGLLVLASAGTGCDSEPEGSCTTSEISSGDHGIQLHEIWPTATQRRRLARQRAGGSTRGRRLAVFTLLRLPALGAN